MRWGLPDMIVLLLGGPLSLGILLSLLSIAPMDAEDPDLEVGGAFPGIGGCCSCEDVFGATFNPEVAVLLVVGAADIDAMCNYELIRCAQEVFGTTARVKCRSDPLARKKRNQFSTEIT